MLLIKAFKELLNQGIKHSLKLVLTGSYGWDSCELMDEIKEINNIYNTPVILTGFVPDEDLSALYNGAYVFVYPSLYEGFGLPVLEAMQCGAPVICSNTSSLPEVVGNCGILIHPDNMNELIDSILLLYNDKYFRDQLGQRSKERANLFSWNKTAFNVISVFNSVLSEYE